MFSTKMFFLGCGEGKIASGNKPLGQENQPASQLMLRYIQVDMKLATIASIVVCCGIALAR